MKLKDLSTYLASLTAAFWVGGMWAVGYLAVPVLFRMQPDRQLAGMLAGHMFTAMAYVGMVCALYLLGYQMRNAPRPLWRQPVFIATLVMLLLVLVGQFIIQPIMAELKLRALPLEVMHSELVAQFKALHGTASILYLIQSLLGIVLLVKLPALKAPDR